MSHPAEDYYVDNRTTTTFPVTTTCNGVVAPDKSCTGSAILGERIHYVRAASTKNPKNAWGWRMPAPYSASKTVEGDTYGLVSFTFGPSSGTYTGCRNSSYPDRSNPRMDYCMGQSVSIYRNIAPPGDIPLSWINYARDVLRTNAMNDLKDRQVNLAVSLAEMQQTVDMIANAGRALADMISCVRKRRCGNLKKRVGDFHFADAWLQYRYGWMPLLSDIFGLYEILRQYLRGDMKRLYVKGRAQMQDDAKVFHPETGYSGVFNFYPYGDCSTTYHSCSCERKIVYEGEYFARYRLDAVLKDDIYNWLENTGITDPLLVLWELIPYSFVADWFANIGAWIDSINAYEGLIPLSYSFTYGRRVRGTESLRLRDVLSSNAISNFQVIKPAYCERFEFKREAGVDVASMGALRFLRKPLDTTQLTDAVTLVSQRIKGR